MAMLRHCFCTFSKGVFSGPGASISMSSSLPSASGGGSKPSERASACTTGCGTTPAISTIDVRVTGVLEDVPEL